MRHLGDREYHRDPDDWTEEPPVEISEAEIEEWEDDYDDGGGDFYDDYDYVDLGETRGEDDLGDYDPGLEDR